MRGWTFWSFVVVCVFSISANSFAERRKPPVPGGGHTQNPAQPVPRGQRALNRQQIQEQRDKDQEAVDALIKQMQADQAEMDAQAAAIKKGLAEHERAINAVVPEYLYALYLKKYDAIIPRVQALQKAIADGKVVFPERIPMDEALEFQLNELLKGATGKKTKVLREMSDEARAKALPNEKNWLLSALARLESIEHAATVGEKLKDRILKLDEVQRLGIIQPSTKEQADLYKSVFREAMGEARATLKNPGDTSLFHEKHRDLIWAQPPIWDLENKLEVVDEFNHLGATIRGATDAQIKKSNPKMPVEGYETFRDGQAANYFFKFLWGMTGRKVEDIPVR